MAFLKLYSNFKKLFERLGFALICTAAAALTIVWSSIGWTQLSPGDLNAVHADLEGLKNCEKCHQTGKQISSDNCLECHTLLKTRIESKTGLHSSDGYADCVKCHVEHLGKNSELIWWNNGIGNFDHSLTGYTLDGKHKRLECRKCHTKNNIADKKVLESQSKKSDRTYLGLSPSCLNCHIDEHRGRLSSDCLKCHDMNGWKPPSRFSHANTVFQLIGRHQETSCIKCHPMITDHFSEENPDYLQFAPVKHDLCLDCHRDPHKGKFEQACENCHSPTGWKYVQKTNFNHSKTGFPLLGRHAAALCEKCHSPEKPLTGLKFALCSDCHADYHDRQFADRPRKGACEECHSVNGFAPANFGIEEHNRSKYPLVGSHLAIPCAGCHPKTELDARSTAIRFRYESTRCIVCHRDPHKGAADKYLKTDGCEYCHSPQSWKSSAYDHSRSRFALTGRHSLIACESCHHPAGIEPAVDRLKFDGLTKECRDCHIDIHRGQFKETVATEGNSLEIVLCSRCHTTSNWKPDNFDHNTRASFKLEGAHLKIPCAGCHKKLGSGEKTYILYKPLEHACRSCHQTVKALE